MGCDIHPFVEVQLEEGSWDLVLKPELTEYGFTNNYYFSRMRNYDLFGVLADVRNGTYGEEFVPIAEPRGLPDDISCDVKAISEDWGIDGHSHSYLTLKELLDYDWNREILHTACVAGEVFDHLKPNEAPREYCTHTTGRTTKIYDADEYMEAKGSGTLVERPFVKHSWKMQYAQVFDYFLKTYLPRLQELHPDPKRVRVVFWFDN